MKLSKTIINKKWAHKLIHILSWKKENQKELDDLWHLKIHFESQIWHFLTNCHSPYSQNNFLWLMLNFGKNILLFRTQHRKNSITELTNICTYYSKIVGMYMQTSKSIKLHIHTYVHSLLKTLFVKSACVLEWQGDPQLVQSI